jgi:hypothetical protein
MKVLRIKEDALQWVLKTKTIWRENYPGRAKLWYPSHWGHVVVLTTQ